MAVLAGFGLFLALSALWTGQPAQTWAAAPEGNGDLSLSLLPHANGITCTLATTTTDSLPGINSFANAAILADYTGLALVKGNAGDEKNPVPDYFRLDNATVGWTYEVDAVPDGLGNYNLGIIAYDASQTPILTDTNPFDGNSAHLSLVAATEGPYYFKIVQYSAQCSGGTYHLEANALSPTPTPGPGTSTPPPTGPPPPTTIPGADRFEPNYDFDHAATLATSVTYDNLNFVPWGGGSEDNDYYKIWVKPGLLYICETLNLAPGLDTNMIFYTANRSLISGNDDVALGDYRSRLSYFSTYEGFLYVLVGHGGRFPLSEVEDSTYSVRCAMSTSDQEASPSPEPPSTPHLSPTPPFSPLATPTPQPELTIRLLGTPTPLPSAATPSLHFVPIDVLVYYDANNDRSPGAGEGVPGISILAYDTSTGEQIAQGLTDELGSLEFTSAAQGLIRLGIPYLGISYLVDEEGATLYIRIAPSSIR
jgi:hypothetical protein